MVTSAWPSSCPSSENSVEPAPPKVLEVATGPEEGAYYRVARRLKDLLAEEGLTLNVRATKGSIENIGRLSRARDAEGAVDVAFVQGGTGTEWRDSLQSISSMYFEPVWVFCRGDPPRALFELEGKRIAEIESNIGTEPSSDLLAALDAVESEVEKVSVPPSYGLELYSLRFHINMVRERV